MQEIRVAAFGHHQLRHGQTMDVFCDGLGLIRVRYSFIASTDITPPLPYVVPSAFSSAMRRY